MDPLSFLPPGGLYGQHLLSMAQLQAADIQQILDVATDLQKSPQSIANGKRVWSTALRGYTIVHVFYEPSTRTRVSFELAAQRLGATTVYLGLNDAALQKGESLADTLSTLAAMHADVIVLRHPHSGLPQALATHLQARLVNAGDGAHQHPTQALLDLLTLREHFGHLDNLQVAIVGDVLHSRVARSTAQGLCTMGAQVRLAGPRALLPRDGLPGCRLCSNLAEALQAADAVIALRLQQERMPAGLFAQPGEYARSFGINAARLQQAQPHVVVLHPGPVQRGVELSDDLLAGPRSLVATQVKNGVAVRSAVLQLILRGSENNPGNLGAATCLA